MFLIHITMEKLNYCIDDKRDYVLTQILRLDVSTQLAVPDLLISLVNHLVFHRDVIALYWLTTPDWHTCKRSHSHAHIDLYQYAVALCLLQSLSFNVDRYITSNPIVLSFMFRQQMPFDICLIVNYAICQSKRVCIDKMPFRRNCATKTNLLAEHRQFRAKL